MQVLCFENNGMKKTKGSLAKGGFWQAHQFACTIDTMYSVCVCVKLDSYFAKNKNTNNNTNNNFKKAKWNN